MYIKLESTSEIFQFDNLWYMGNSSVIYKEDDLLYKIFLKNTYTNIKKSIKSVYLNPIAGIKNKVSKSKTKNVICSS